MQAHEQDFCKWGGALSQILFFSVCKMCQLGSVLSKPVYFAQPQQIPNEFAIKSFLEKNRRFKVIRTKLRSFFHFVAEIGNPVEELNLAPCLEVKSYICLNACILELN